MPRASEVCRRLLDSAARVQGIYTSVAERLAPLRGVDDDDDIDIDEDDLAAYRDRTAAGVALVRDDAIGEPRLLDCSGRNRSDAEVTDELGARRRRRTG
jgi:hypothetical protein